MVAIYTFLLFSLPGLGAFVNFTNPERDYTMDLTSNARYSRLALKDGYMDVFNAGDPERKGEPVYILTVLKTLPIVTVDYDQLFSEEFKKGYLKTCDCQVTDVRPADYEYEKGVVYMITSKLGNQLMRGYSITFLKGKSMYNIEFYTKNESFDQVAPEFFHTINSFHISRENRSVTEKN